MMTFLMKLILVLMLGMDLAFAETVPDVAFLTIKQGQAAIVDEQIEPYFSLLQTREMSAKTGTQITGATLGAQRDVCRKRYQAAVQEFSDLEQSALLHVVKNTHPFLELNYPVFAALPWRFIKVARTIEGGMPFTLGKCIVLSDQVLPMFLAGEVHPQNPKGLNLLLHEQTHVLQRLHPELFIPLFVESWGFVHILHAPTATADLSVRQLINPDGISSLWVFPLSNEGRTEVILPQTLLGGDAVLPSLHTDIMPYALMVEKQGDDYVYLRDASGGSRSMYLQDARVYSRSFTPSEENFHPNEICAELFSRMVTLGILQRHEDETPCQQGLRGWASSYLSSNKEHAHEPLPRMSPPPVEQIVPPRPPNNDEVEHILGKDETLTSVAKGYKVTLKCLIMRNKIGSTDFAVGILISEPCPIRHRRT